MLLEETKEDLNKWQDMPCSGIGRLSSIGMSVFPQLIYRFNVLLIRIPARFWEAIDKLIQKF